VFQKRKIIVRLRKKTVVDKKMTPCYNNIVKNKASRIVMETKITKWTLQGYYPNAPLFGFSEEYGVTQFPATDEMDFYIGESIYNALERHGIIEDPMIDVNSYKCEWVANRWWIFRAQVEIKGEFPRLYFEGIDGVCRVFFNNKFLAKHENSFVPLEIDMSEYSGASGIVTVMVENCTENYNQSGYTAKITAQRPRYDNKWDFCPRLVSLGIVAPVSLRVGADIYDVKIVTENSGKIVVDYKSRFLPEGSIVEFSVEGVVTSAKNSAVCLSLDIKDPVLWNPNGHGDRKLYKATLKAIKNDKTIWEKNYNIGFRQIRFERNENAGEGNLPYTLIVNGERLYIKGVNFVPVAMSRAEFTRERYEKLLTLVTDMNVNFIRVWGGGVIETEEFYEICDKKGILVWQDFTQSSSGIDNCATTLEEGLNNLAKTAKSAVKRIRNHPSLAVYCGGNELMQDWIPLDFDHPNIAMLKKITDDFDGTRIMFPTTASGRSASGKIENVGKNIHADIHGPWTFTGNEKYYEFYNKMDSLLHSEFGADGFCNVETIEKIFSAKERKLSTISGNYVWRHKAEWWNQIPLVEEIFGKCDNLEEMIYLSQFVQAEAVRYAVEANRRRAFNNSGCFIWQFNESYPNLCCTNLVDYFFKPKAAYFAVKQAYSPVNPNMKYSKLYYEPNETFYAELYLTSDIEGEFNYSVTAVTENGRIHCCYSVNISEKGKSEKVGMLDFVMPEKGVAHFYLSAEKNGIIYKNEVLLLVMNGEVCDKTAAIAFAKELKGEQS